MESWGKCKNAGQRQSLEMGLEGGEGESVLDLSSEAIAIPDWDTLSFRWLDQQATAKTGAERNFRPARRTFLLRTEGTMRSLTGRQFTARF